MAIRSGPCHVATITKVVGGKTYQTHLLRRTYREGGKVKHQTLSNLSYLPPHVIELIKGALKGQAFVPADQALEVVRSLPHGHVAAVLGTLRQLGLESLIHSRRCWQRDVVTAMVVSRLIHPDSKLATARGLRQETSISTLGEVLGLGVVDEDKLYEAMDWLVRRQGRIEEKLAGRHLEEGSLVLYDVTSSYYTGRRCSLAKHGHNRDRKKGFPQIVFGLICNKAGCPVSVEVFEGDVADPNTLSHQIEKVRGRFGLRRVIMVGDRGLITEARIREEMSGVEGLDWITALRSADIAALAEEGAIQLSLFDETGLVEVSSSRYPGERLIACRNPLLAEERRRKREELLRATEKELDKIVAATQRGKRGLKGKDKIGLRVGKVINRFKMAKHFKIEIDEKGFRYEREGEKIAREARLDGIYVIRTSVSEEELSAQETVGAYKSLAVVERAFRSLKMIDLKVRPIRHWQERRVRGHVFLCMLAYYVEWHMRAALRPLLFDDDDAEAREGQRESVVSPAKPSPKARRKAQRKRIDDGYPVHSFQTLLKDLATIAKNQIRPRMVDSGPCGDGSCFDVLTTPTPLQHRALDLLGVALKT